MAGAQGSSHQNGISAAFDSLFSVQFYTITDAWKWACTQLQLAELRKDSQLKCAELNWKCIPLAVESYGACGPETLKAFSQVATRLAIRGNTCISKSVTVWSLITDITLIYAPPGGLYRCRI